MPNLEEDVKLVADFLGDALSGRFVVSIRSMGTLKAFKRLKAEESLHVVMGVCKWLKDDDEALQKISDAVIKTYEKCPVEVRSEAANVFAALAERLMNRD